MNKTIRFLLYVSALIFFSYKANAFGFLNSCAARFEQKPSSRTVHALIEESGVSASDPDVCQKAYQILNEKTVYDLQNKSISSLLPLIDLKPSTLLLKGNQISNLWPISFNQNLMVLDASGNHIEDLTPLAFLKGLEFLNLDDNQIKYIMPLKEILNLKRISLENNPVYNDVDEEVAIGIKYKLESLMFFRSHFSNEDHEYQFANLDEATEQLNLCSERGDIYYFRMLKKHDPSWEIISSSQAISSELLEDHAKKMIFAVKNAENLAIFLIEALKMKIEDGKISEKKYREITSWFSMIIEHFIASSTLNEFNLAQLEDFTAFLFEKINTADSNKSIDIATPYIFRKLCYEWQENYILSFNIMSMPSLMRTGS